MGAFFEEYRSPLRITGGDRGRRLLTSSKFGDLAALHDEAQTFPRGNVSQRIAFDGDQVCNLAGGERAQFVVDAVVFGAPDGSGTDRGPAGESSGTLRLQRAYKSFGIRIQIWRTRRQSNRLDPLSSQDSTKACGIFGIPIHDQEARVPKERPPALSLPSAHAPLHRPLQRIAIEIGDIQQRLRWGPELGIAVTTYETPLEQVEQIRTSFADRLGEETN